MMKRSRRRRSFLTIGTKMQDFGRRLMRHYTVSEVDTSPSPERPSPWQVAAQTPLVWSETPPLESEPFPLELVDTETPDSSEIAPVEPPAPESSPPVRRKPAPHSPASGQEKPKIDPKLLRILEAHDELDARRDQIRQQKKAILSTPEVQRETDADQSLPQPPRPRRGSAAVNYVETAPLMPADEDAPSTPPPVVQRHHVEDAETAATPPETDDDESSPISPVDLSPPDVAQRDSDPQPPAPAFDLPDMEDTEDSTSPDQLPVEHVQRAPEHPTVTADAPPRDPLDTRADLEADEDYYNASYDTVFDAGSGADVPPDVGRDNASDTSDEDDYYNTSYDTVFDVPSGADVPADAQPWPLDDVDNAPTDALDDRSEIQASAESSSNLPHGSPNDSVLDDDDYYNTSYDTVFDVQSSAELAADPQHWPLDDAGEWGAGDVSDADFQHKTEPVADVRRAPMQPDMPLERLDDPDDYYNMSFDTQIDAQPLSRAPYYDSSPEFWFAPLDEEEAPADESEQSLDLFGSMVASGAIPPAPPGTADSTPRPAPVQRAPMTTDAPDGTVYSDEPPHQPLHSMDIYDALEAGGNVPPAPPEQPTPPANVNERASPSRPAHVQREPQPEPTPHAESPHQPLHSMDIYQALTTAGAVPPTPAVDVNETPSRPASVGRTRETPPETESSADEAQTPHQPLHSMDIYQALQAAGGVPPLAQDSESLAITPYPASPLERTSGDSAAIQRAMEADLLDLLDSIPHPPAGARTTNADGYVSRSYSQSAPDEPPAASSYMPAPPDHVMREETASSSTTSSNGDSSESDEGEDVNIDKLARDVYSLLRDRLRIERERSTRTRRT